MNKIWQRGALGGLILGIVVFILVLGKEFFLNFTSFNMWWNFFLTVIETTIAGGLLFFAYDKLMKSKINKILVWVIYSAIVIVILWFTVMWIFALKLGAGIVGL